jgi:hypothetical protein
MSSKATGRRGREMRAMIVDRKPSDRPAGNKGGGKPSSEHISGRRKSWLSEREAVDGRGNDAGARSGQPWFRSPLMKTERARRAATRASSNG